MAATNSLQAIADTLSGRLAMIFALLILPPTIVSLYLAWASLANHKASAKLQVRQFATLAATYESSFFNDVRKTLQQLGKDEAVRDGGVEECDSLLDAALDRTPEFTSLALFDVDGGRVCGSEEGVTDASNHAWLEEVRQFRSFTISNYMVAPNSPFPVIIAAQAVYQPDGRLHGVLAASIRLFWLSTFMRDINLPPESVIFVIDRNGNVLADRAAIARPLEGEGRGVAAPSQSAFAALVPPDAAAATLSRRQTDFEGEGSDGVRRVFSSVELPHGDVTVLFGMPAESAFGGLEADFAFRVLGVLAIVLAGFGAAWLGARFLVTRWTSSLRAVAHAYGRADYGSQADYSGAPLELRDLGEALTVMAKRVEKREAELRASLRQKDMLLKEIHHRVKNNLQIVGSLLNIRTGGAKGEAETEALAEVKAHVRALALVHRHLYESDDVQAVNLRPFMTELCRTALAGLLKPSQNVTLEFDIPDFMLSTDRAIPIALLVTEAITNALKHAFPGGQAGSVRVSFAPEGPRSGVLTVADDGVGIGPEAIHSTGIGLQLIEAFANQVGGELLISGPPGAVIRLSVDDGEGDASDARLDEIRAA